MKNLFFILAIISLNGAYSQSWQIIGEQDLGHVNDIIEYNGNTYITGDFEEINGVVLNHIAMWNGNSWQALGTGLDQWGYGNCLEVYNNELYVGGYFQSAGGVSLSKLAKWNGSSWSAVSSNFSMMLAVKDLETIGTRLYIGGSPDVNCSTPDVNIVSWDGVNIGIVGSGELKLLANSSVNGTVRSLTEYQGELYAAGWFDDAQGISCQGLIKWNGTNWVALPSGLPSSNNLDVEFIAGKLTIASNNPGVKQWDGSNWVNYLQGWSGNGSTYTMTEFNQVPIIGGFYNNVPYSLNGSGVWSPIGFITGSPAINQLKIINNELYAVGRNQILVNGSYLSHTLVAKWTGGPLSTVLTESSIQLEISPNPTNGICIINADNLDGSDVYIYNVLNELIEHRSKVTFPLNIDFSNHPAGVYFIRIATNQGESISKVVVK